MILYDHFRNELRTLVSENYASCRYVLAVSGGIDSMVLLSLMKRAISNKNFLVAHVNHNQRALHSETDAQFVRNYCKDHALNFTQTKLPAQSFSEAQMREQRYSFLHSVRQEFKADFVVTAHHAQDQLETFFLRLLRGTGVVGLSGMRQKNETLLRPLLKVSREALQEYAKKHKVIYRDDLSNRETRYYRNHLRKHLIPEIEVASRRYGGMERFLERFEGLLAELRSHNGCFKADFQLTQTDFFVRVPLEEFLKQSRNEQQHFLREIYCSLNAEVPTRKQMAQILNNIDSAKRSFSAPGKIQILKSCGYLYFQTQKQRDKARALRLLGNQETFECAALGFRAKLPRNLQKDYELRFFLAGDRLGSKKLKELFLSQRIPRPERELFPLLAKHRSHEVVWLYPQSDPRITIEGYQFPLARNVALDT